MAIVGLIGGVAALTISVGAVMIVWGLYLLLKDLNFSGASSTPDPTAQATAIAAALVDAGIKGGDKITHNYHAPIIDNTIVAIDASVKIDISQLSIMFFLGMPSKKTKLLKNPTANQAWKEMLRKREELINNLQNWVNDTKHDSSDSNFDVDDRIQNMRMLTGFTTVYSDVQVSGSGKKVGGKTVLSEGQKLDLKNPFMVLNDPFGVYHSELFRSAKKSVQTQNYKESPKLHLLNTDDMHKYYEVYRTNYLKIWGETKEGQFIKDYDQMVKIVESMLTILQSHLNILNSFSDTEIVAAISCINRVEKTLWNYRLFGALFTLDPKLGPVDWSEFEAWWNCWATNDYGIKWLWDHKNDPRHIGYILYKLDINLKTLNSRKKLRDASEDLLICLRRYDDKRDAKSDYRLRDGIQMLHAFLSDKKGEFRFDKNEHKKMHFAFEELSRVYSVLELNKNKEFIYFSSVQSFLKKLNALHDESQVPMMVNEFEAIVSLYRSHVDKMKKVYVELNPKKSLYQNEDFRLGLFYAINEAKKVNKWGVKGLCKDEVQGMGISMVPLSHGIKSIPIIPTDVKCSKKTQDWYDWWVGKRGIAHYADRITKVHADSPRLMDSWENLQSLAEFYLVEVRVEKATGQQIPVDGFEALYSYLTKLIQTKDNRVTDEMRALYTDLQRIYDGFYRGWADHINQFLKLLEQKNGIAAKNHSKGSPEELKLFNETRERFRSTTDFFAEEGNRLSKVVSEIKPLWDKHGCILFESILNLADADGVTKYDRVVGKEVGVEPGIILEDVVPHGFDLKKIQDKINEPITRPRLSVNKDCLKNIEDIASKVISASKQVRGLETQVRGLLTDPDNTLAILSTLKANARMLSQARHQMPTGPSGAAFSIELLLYALSGRDGDTTKMVDEILYSALVPHVAGLPQQNTLVHLSKVGGIRRLVHLAKEYGNDNLNTWLNDMAYDKDANRNAAYDGKVDEYLHNFTKLPGVLHDIPIAWNHAMKLLSKDKLSQIAVCALIDAGIEAKFGSLEDIKDKPSVKLDALNAYLLKHKQSQSLKNVWKKHRLSRRQIKFAKEVSKNPEMEHKVIQFNQILQGETLKIITDEKELEKIKGELDRINKTPLEQFNVAQIDAVFSGIKGGYGKFKNDVVQLQELFNKPSAKQLVRAEATRYSYYSRFKRNYSKLIKETHNMFSMLEEVKTRLKTGVDTMGKGQRNNSPGQIKQLISQSIAHIDKAIGHIKQYSLKMDAEEEYCNKRISEALEEAVRLISENKGGKK